MAHHGDPRVPSDWDNKHCALCGVDKKTTGPLCQPHEDEFLKEPESLPFRFTEGKKTVDCRFETVLKAYIGFVTRRKAEGNILPGRLS